MDVMLNTWKPCIISARHLHARSTWEYCHVYGYGDREHSGMKRFREIWQHVLRFTLYFLTKINEILIEVIYELVSVRVLTLELMESEYLSRKRIQSFFPQMTWRFEETAFECKLRLETVTWKWWLLDLFEIYQLNGLLRRYK